MRRDNTMSTQRGYAIVAMILVVMGSAMAVVLGYSSLMAKEIARDFDHHQQAYLQQTKIAVSEWYRREAAAIDAVDAAPSMTAIMSGAGIAPQWRLQLAASKRLSRGAIAYRVIALWIPASGTDASTLDVDRGAFTPDRGTQYVLIDGFSIQSQAAFASLETMKTLASRLEERFYARFLHDAEGDITVNWFRPRDSNCNAHADELACTDTAPGRFLAAANMNLARLLGMPPTGLVNAWGGPVELCNSAPCANTAAPPFSLTLRSATPWGTQLTVVATQHL